MLKISIPEPCHEDWGRMTPNEHGRHCNSCAKTVVDFTGMSDEEVKYFFLNKKEERVCGRFRNGQLHRITIYLPENIFYIQLPFWKKFLVASLVVFSTTIFSCNTSINGKTVKIDESIPSVIEKIKTEKNKGIYTGIAFTKLGPTYIITPPVCTVTTGISAIYDSSFTKGDIAIQPVEPVSKPEIMKADTMLDEIPTMGLPVITGQVAKKDSLKKIPKKDSIHCNSIQYF